MKDEKRTLKANIYAYAATVFGIRYIYKLKESPLITKDEAEFEKWEKSVFPQAIVFYANEIYHNESLLTKDDKDMKALLQITVDNFEELLDKFELKYGKGSIKQYIKE